MRLEGTVAIISGRPLVWEPRRGTDHGSATPHTPGGSAGESPTVTTLPLLAYRHAAFETDSQIVLTDRAQGVDDFFLISNHLRHLAIRGHISIYVDETSEPDFPRKCD